MRSLLLTFALLSTSFALAQPVGDYSIPLRVNPTGPQTLKTWPKANSALWGTDASGNPQSITLSGLSLSNGVLTAAGGGSGAWSGITGKPTTLAGYGIADSITAALAASTYQPLIGAGTLALSKLAIDPLARANHTGTQDVSTVTGTRSIAGGGTSATTAAAARVALLPSMTGNASKVLSVKTDASDYELTTPLTTGNIILFSTLSTAPSSNPSAGFFYLYIEPSDHTLRSRGPSGTITVLANP
jgi:hypothetical protein